MVRLEELTKGTQVKGILPNSLVTIVDAQWHGSDVVELTYKDASGSLRHELVFRDREPTLEIVTEALGALLPMALTFVWYRKPIAFV